MKKLPKEFDYSKTYYKIIDKYLNHNGLIYCDENGKPFLNTVIKEFRTGGISFSSEWKIFNFWSYGDYIAEIKIPEGTKVVLVPPGNKYRSDGIIIKSLTPISDFKFNDSIDWINNLEKQKLTNDELLNIIYFSSKEYKDKAWNLLKNNKPSIYNLSYVIENCIEPYKSKAWSFLKTNCFSEKNLKHIINYSTKEYRKKAEDLLNNK